MTRAASTAAGVARAAWRRLRTMRTAIILLLLLGAGAAVGSLFPQRPISEASVDRWVARNRGWAGTAERLGLFDVYGSWWFMGIYALLLVSLVGCLVPRYRAWVRALRRRPFTAAALPSQQHYRSGTVALSPEVALASAESVLRTRRFRLARANGTVAGEKGHFREGGSLIFHTAFLVLLVGMSIGKAFGFSGQVAVVEGERFADTHIEYDFISEGRFFGERHTGLELALDDFDVSWHPNGVPKGFVSSVRLFDGDRLVRREDIHVNSPLTVGSVRFYELSWGWAPRIRVTQNGTVLYDAPTVFLSRSGLKTGVAKAPGAKPFQTGLEMFFYADPDIDERGNPFDRGPEPRSPLVVFEQYVGDLGLDKPQSVYELDPRGLVPAEAGALRLGETAKLARGIEVSFPELRQYAVFQIASNPGAPVLLAAAVMILVGLLPALYSSRRRIWIRAAPEDGVARLEIAGHALQRRAAFEEEFKALVRDLDRDLHARAGARDG